MGLPRYGHAFVTTAGYSGAGRLVGVIRMSKLKTWFSKRRWRKQHQADIRAFLRFQSERSARRRAAAQLAH
jgi:hypothetical protein